MKIDLQSTLKNLGVELKGINPDGRGIVSTPDGQDREIDIDSTLKQLGIEPGSHQFAETNTPDTPLQISPVRAIGRGMLDVRGQSSLPGSKELRDSVDFLKNRFEDARVNQNGAMVVKEKGMWHQVDPDFFADFDPWETSLQLMKGNPTRAKQALNEVAGDAMEFSTEAIDGLARIPGVGKGVRTVLGKLAGIDKSTPAEALAENFWDTALTLGTGAALKLGSKVYINKIAPGLKNIAEKASENVKASIATAASILTGMKDTNMAKLLSSGEANARYMEQGEKLLKEAVNASPGKVFVRGKVNEIAEDQAVGPFTKAIKNFGTYVSNKFGKGLDEIAALPTAGKFSSSSLNKAFDDDFSGLVADGLLTRNKDILSISKDYMKQLQATPRQQKLAQELIDNIKLANNVKLQGKSGLDVTLRLNRKLNEIARDLFDDEDKAGAEFIKILGPLVAKTKSAISKDVDAIGGGQIWNGINKMWVDTQAARKMSAQVADIHTGLKKGRTFLNQYFNRDPQMEQNLRIMSQYSDGTMARTMQIVDDIDVAKDVATYLPDASKVQASFKGLANAILPAKAVTKVARPAVAMAEIPEKAARLTNEAMHLLKDNLKLASPAAREALLQNEDMINELLGGVLGTEQNIRSMSTELLKRGLGQ